MAREFRVNDSDILNRTDGTKWLQFRNFSCRDNGEYKSDYPNTNIVLTDDAADYLRSAGFRVVDYTTEDGTVMHRLKINARFDNYPPHIYKKCGKKKIEITEDTIHKLDRDEIIGMDLWLNLSSKGAAYISKAIIEIEYDDFYKILNGDEEDDYID